MGDVADIIYLNFQKGFNKISQQDSKDSKALGIIGKIFCKILDFLRIPSFTKIPLWREFSRKHQQAYEYLFYSEFTASSGDTDEKMTNFADNAKLFSTIKTKASCNKLQKVIIKTVWTWKISKEYQQPLIQISYYCGESKLAMYTQNRVLGVFNTSIQASAQYSWEIMKAAEW